MGVFIGIAIITVIVVIIFRNNSGCPDCGPLVACDQCSNEMDKIDEELDR